MLSVTLPSILLREEQDHFLFDCTHKFAYWQLFWKHFFGVQEVSVIAIMEALFQLCMAEKYLSAYDNASIIGYALFAVWRAN